MDNLHYNLSKVLHSLSRWQLVGSPRYELVEELDAHLTHTLPYVAPSPHFSFTYPVDTKVNDLISLLGEAWLNEVT